MPQITEQNIRLTVQMLDTRDHMKRFFGDQYEARIEPFRDAIRRWTAETGKPKAEIALAVCKITEREGSGFDVALAISAFVEECNG